MTFPLSWQNCNPKRLPLPPNKYVTVIPVHSTKLATLGLAPTSKQSLGIG
jgi:hypothetical protein